MNTLETDRLYDLLPSVYRLRDHHEGEPLRALLRVIERELQALERDVGGLYENWFIETCSEWLVPYIGDLLGVRGLHPGVRGIFSLRAFIANTLAYRRRKGTIGVLEQLARDVTGWPARSVEYPWLLGTTQHLNHLRPHNHRTPDLRDFDALDLHDTPFDGIAHTADVRRVASERGRFNIPNVGLHMWRLQNYEVIDSPALPADIPDPSDPDTRGKSPHTFHPLGYPTVLFTNPETETRITHLAEEINVPGPIRQTALEMDLKRFQERHQDTEFSELSESTEYYGPERSLAIYLKQGKGKGEGRLISPMFVACAELKKPERKDGGVQQSSEADRNVWCLPEWRGPREYLSKHGMSEADVDLVAIDVERGRLAFANDLEKGETVEVLYNYGFSAGIGGGSYNRRDSMEPRREGTVITPYDGKGVATDPVNIRLPPNGASLVIEAEDGVQLNFSPGRPADPRERIKVSLPEGGSASLTLNGLRIEGGIEIEGGDGDWSLDLKLVHCTLVPGGHLNEHGEPRHAAQPSLELSGKVGNLEVSLSHCITGPLRLPVETRLLRISDSIVDAPLHRQDGAQGGTGQAPVRTVAIGAGGDPERYGPPIHLERSTVFGRVMVRELALASEVIFTGRVEVERIQQGCARYSYFPRDSRVPRRFRCQPEHASSLASGDVERRRIRARLFPVFTSMRYGEAAYAQLAANCPDEIRRGAEDGSEMGVFSNLKQPQREANLRASLDEYLPFGLEAGVFYIT